MPRRVFFADVLTPMTLTQTGREALAGHHLALQQDTDDGLVFRVEADTAEQAATHVIDMVGDVGVISAIYPADQVLAGGEPVAAVIGEFDPRVGPPPLSFGLPADPPDDNSGGAWEPP
jgi:hypothetical protein